jgi:beta-glucosidase
MQQRRHPLLDHVDWDVALREVRGRVNPLGLCDLDRRPRRVGLAYKRLVEAWRPGVSSGSTCLRVPLAAWAAGGASAG